MWFKKDICDTNIITIHFTAATNILINILRQLYSQRYAKIGINISLGYTCNMNTGCNLTTLLIILHQTQEFVSGTGSHTLSRKNDSISRQRVRAGT